MLRNCTTENRVFKKKLGLSWCYPFSFILDLRINWTLQIPIYRGCSTIRHPGAVANRTYRVGLNAVRGGNRTYRGANNMSLFCYR